MPTPQHRLSNLPALYLALSLCACGPTGTVEMSLELRFATAKQAQTDQGGLPDEIRSLKVEVLEAGLGSNLLASSGCVALAGDSPQRRSVRLDLAPATNATLFVGGWSAPGCVGAPGWRGLTTGVSVAKGEETAASVYVTRGGGRLNPIRDSLPTARAFASATALPDGRVLIAGGFDQLDLDGAAPELLAACDAVLYHPGRAAFERTIPLAGSCRGLHRALSLSDGRVVLLGGCGRAVIDAAGTTRPMLRPDAETLIASAEVFDPEDEVFVSLERDEALNRAEAAAALLADGSLVLMGGRTSQLRSSEIVVGSPTASTTWQWQLAANPLVAKRTSARALALDQGLLVVGGNLPNQPDMELIDTASFESQAVTPTGAELPELALAGHSLTAGTAASFLLVGGAANVPGSTPLRNLVRGTWSEDTYALEVRQLERARAYHTAIEVPGLSAAEAGTLLVGGLNEQFVAEGDLEWVPPDQDSHLLQATPSTGALGVAGAILPDGSALLVGGLDVDGSTAHLSAQGQIFTP